MQILGPTARDTCTCTESEINRIISLATNIKIETFTNACVIVSCREAAYKIFHPI